MKLENTGENRFRYDFYKSIWFTVANLVKCQQRFKNRKKA